MARTMAPLVMAQVMLETSLVDAAVWTAADCYPPCWQPWLVLAFINAALLLLLLGIEFLPILFIIVYVGAIAILFLFVIMLLNIKLVELNQNSTRYLPVSTIIAAIFLSQLLPTIPVNNNWLENTFNSIDFNELIKLTNIQNIGNLLYTEYWLYFILSSMVLLVSMIGAILLCLSHENVIKRQDLFAQVDHHLQLRFLPLW